MTRPIRWELIEQNYDMLVKYATAIRVGTASTEAILRRSPATPRTPLPRRSSLLGTSAIATYNARSKRA
jgi:TnpA family transposase